MISDSSNWILDQRKIQRWKTRVQGSLITSNLEITKLNFTLLSRHIKGNETWKLTLKTSLLKSTILKYEPLTSNTIECNYLLLWNLFADSIKIESKSRQNALKWFGADRAMVKQRQDFSWMINVCNLWRYGFIADRTRKFFKDAWVLHIFRHHWEDQLVIWLWTLKAAD